MKNYAIFNPLNGQYVFANTKSECVDVMSNICFNFYLHHSHNAPISTIEYLEDGSQVWKTNDEEIILTKEFLEEKSNNFLSNI
jgi:hypothetical protein